MRAIDEQPPGDSGNMHAADIRRITEAAGLTTDQAHRLLGTIGPNTIADVAQHPVTRAFEKLWAPVPWMLEAAIALQLGLGDYTEAAVVTPAAPGQRRTGIFPGEPRDGDAGCPQVAPGAIGIRKA